MIVSPFKMENIEFFMCAKVLSNDRILGLSYSELWYENNFESQKNIIFDNRKYFWYKEL